MIGLSPGIEPIYDLLTILILILLMIMVAGLVKPWYVLWFLEKKNRLKVLKFFGTILLILILLQIVLAHYFISL